jgi:hypothetical protein
MANITKEEIVEQYNAVLKQANKLDFFVRDNDLQKSSINELRKFLGYVKSYKHQAAERGDKESANLFFHFQCVLNSSICSLNMWLELKRRKYHKAWNNLIEAQEYISYALKCADGSVGISDYSERLKKVEETIFPGFPVYQSLGLRFEGGVCSVCGRPLEECEHVEEEIYLGTLCKRIRIEKIDIDHTAIVRESKDRRCIPTEFEFEPGKIYDYISLRYLRDKSINEKSEGAYMKGILYCMKDLDLF